MDDCFLKLLSKFKGREKIHQKESDVNYSQDHLIIKFKIF
jgi:hypothetical protein